MWGGMATFARVLAFLRLLSPFRARACSGCGRVGAVGQAYLVWPWLPAVMVRCPGCCATEPGAQGRAAGPRPS